MQRLVEWDKRWMWPFQVYEPVFTAAKELGIPLVALNVNTEDLQLVEKGGLPGLPRDRLQQYIPDATGFAAFAKAKQFTTYVNYVIRPSYELHQAMGLLSYSITGETGGEMSSETAAVASCGTRHLLYPDKTNRVATCRISRCVRKIWQGYSVDTPHDKT
jgi:hypothetical protein